MTWYDIAEALYSIKAGISFGRLDYALGALKTLPDTPLSKQLRRDLTTNNAKMIPDMSKLERYYLNKHRKVVNHD